MHASDEFRSCADCFGMGEVCGGCHEPDCECEDGHDYPAVECPECDGAGFVCAVCLLGPEECECYYDDEDTEELPDAD